MNNIQKTKSITAIFYYTQLDMGDTFINGDKRKLGQMGNTIILLANPINQEEICFQLEHIYKPPLKKIIITKCRSWNHQTLKRKWQHAIDRVSRRAKVLKQNYIICFKDENQKGIRQIT